MRCRLTFTFALLSALLLTASAADEKDAGAARRALQEVGEFVGEWKGTGEVKSSGRSTFWKETLNWGWKFKGGDAWITLEVKDGKFVTSGELRYDPEKKIYRLKVTDADRQEQTYEGKLARGRLVLERKDVETGDVHRLTVYTLADGARMVVHSELQSKGRGLFSDVFKVGATREGESIAGGGGKKTVCIVTGGLGTMPVSYMGKTYHVCCTGCRDEFNEDPKKYVDEFERGKR
jgi:major membrane immunogen (membrane-anchored lipoprotein)